MKRGALLFWSSTLAAAALLVIWCGGGTRDVARADAPVDRTSPVPSDQLTTSGPPARDELARTTVGIDELRFTGKVVDPDGAPIPGASVAVFLSMGDSGSPLVETRVDAQGGFALSTSTWPDVVEVRVQAAGHIGMCEAVSRADLLTATEPETVMLDWVVPVRGRVRDAVTAMPIAGASVGTHHETVIADGSGDYLMPEVDMGELTLFARADGHASKTVHALLRRPVPAQIDIDLDPCTSFSAQVVDRETGAPIPGADVETGRETLAKTDADGRFSLCFPAGARVAIVVQAADYAPFFWDWTVEETLPQALRLPLTRCGRLDGRVVDERGRPWPGVSIGAGAAEVDDADALDASERERFGVVGRVPRRPRDDRMQVVRAALTETDTAGVFHLPVLPSPTPLVVVARHAELELAPRTGITVPAGASRWIEIAGRRTAWIHGKLRHNGEPCAGTIEWRPTHGKPTSTWGRAEYAIAVIPGAGQLVLRPERSRDDAVLVELSVAAGENHERDLDWIEELSDIRGTVHDSAGAPLAMTRVIAVAAEDENGRSFEAWTAADGTYVLRVPRTGEFDVTARRGSSAREEHGVSAGATGVDFVFVFVFVSARLGKARLRLVDATTGAPIASHPGAGQFTWRLVGDRAVERADAQIDVEGRCDLDLPVGDVDLEMDPSLAGYAPCRIARLVVGTDPNAAPTTMALQRGVDVVVHASVPDRSVDEREHVVLLLRDDQMSDVGEPPAEQASADQCQDSVREWIREPRLLRQTVVCRDGSCSPLRALAPGRYTLRAFPDDLVFDPPAIDVAPPEMTVEVRCKPR